MPYELPSAPGLDQDDDVFYDNLASEVTAAREATESFNIELKRVYRQQRKKHQPDNKDKGVSYPHTPLSGIRARHGLITDVISTSRLLRQ